MNIEPNENERQYLTLIMSMTLERLQNGISKETYALNLEVFAKMYVLNLKMGGKEGFRN